uniref:Uncharacterized protein n=1 Tax=uncultured bacterium A1Q1_fos_2037 TaxID=1256558 RepID=L7VZD1_9BACT|nr:hypothetical protein [uncultured bacterium A1Q1_fos_2037]
MFFLPRLLRRGLPREKFCDGFPEFTDTLPCLGGDGQDRRRFSDLQRTGDLSHTPGALSSFHVVDLGRDRQGRKPQACKVLTCLHVESRCPDSRVHQMYDGALRMRGPQIVVDHFRPLAPRLLRGSGVPESRQVDEIEGAVDPEVVDRLGPAGSGARTRQLPAQKLVQKTRLSYVRASGKCDLRQPVQHEPFATRRRLDELRLLDPQCRLRSASGICCRKGTATCRESPNLPGTSALAGTVPASTPDTPDPED